MLRSHLWPRFERTEDTKSDLVVRGSDSQNEGGKKKTRSSRRRRFLAF